MAFLRKRGTALMALVDFVAILAHMATDMAEAAEEEVGLLEEVESLEDATDDEILSSAAYLSSEEDDVYAAVVSGGGGEQDEDRESVLRLRKLLNQFRVVEEEDSNPRCVRWTRPAGVTEAEAVAAIEEARKHRYAVLFAYSDWQAAFNTTEGPNDTTPANSSEPIRFCRPPNYDKRRRGSRDLSRALLTRVRVIVVGGDEHAPAAISANSASTNTAPPPPPPPPPAAAAATTKITTTTTTTTTSSLLPVEQLQLAVAELEREGAIWIRQVERELANLLRHRRPHVAATAVGDGGGKINHRLIVSCSIVAVMALMGLVAFVLFDVRAFFLKRRRHLRRVRAIRRGQQRGYEMARYV
jgi:hypothetical protein